MHPMRRFTVVLCGVVILAAAVAATRPPAVRRDAKSTAGVDRGDAARGGYLVSIAGCNDCHTPGTFYGAPDHARLLSGSEMGWAGPWGTVYAANLTPDRE